MMDVRPIRSEADYDWALAEVEAYFESEPARGTPEADRFDVLVSLIEGYESKAWPIEAPDPIATVEAVMEARGLKTKDLALVIGSRSRATEVLRRTRGLTVDMIDKLNKKWRISADALVRPYHLRRDDKCLAHLAKGPKLAYVAYLHREKGSEIGVSFPDFPGIATAGATLDEAKSMAAEALALHMQGMLEDGEEIPAPSSMEEITEGAQRQLGTTLVVPIFIPGQREAKA